MSSVKYISLNVDPHENNLKKLCFGENDADNLGSATPGVYLPNFNLASSCSSAL